MSQLVWEARVSDQLWQKLTDDDLEKITDSLDDYYDQLIEEYKE